MTNILATIALTVTTNWLTVSTTTPVCTIPGCIVMHHSTDNQIGARVTNTVAIIAWKGRTNSYVLESTEPFFGGDLERKILKPLWNSVPNLTVPYVP